MIKGGFFEHGFDKKSGGTGSEAGEVLMMLVIVGRTAWFSCSSFVEWEQDLMIWGQWFGGFSNWFFCDWCERL